MYEKTHKGIIDGSDLINPVAKMLHGMRPANNGRRCFQDSKFMIEQLQLFAATTYHYSESGSQIIRHSLHTIYLHSDLALTLWNIIARKIPIVGKVTIHRAPIYT